MLFRVSDRPVFGISRDLSLDHGLEYYFLLFLTKSVKVCVYSISATLAYNFQNTKIPFKKNMI